MHRPTFGTEYRTVVARARRYAKHNPDLTYLVIWDLEDDSSAYGWGIYTEPDGNRVISLYGAYCGAEVSAAGTLEYDLTGRVARDTASR